MKERIYLVDTLVPVKAHVAANSVQEAVKKAEGVVREIAEQINKHRSAQADTDNVEAIQAQLDEGGDLEGYKVWAEGLRRMGEHHVTRRVEFNSGRSGYED